VVDVCVAGFIALVFWMNVGVSSQTDTNPPTCTTATGREVDCDLEGPARLAQLAVFVGVLVALGWFQVVRAGRRRDSQGQTQ
jgi:hypothetical protein